MILNDLALVQSCCTINREYGEKSYDSSDTEVRCLMKNAVADNRFNSDAHNLYHITKKYIDAFNEGKLPVTKKEDILFKLSSPYDCVVIGKNEEGYLVPNSFALIRCKDNKQIENVIRYLSDEVMIRFLEKESGNKGRITISALREMPVGTGVIHILGLFEKQQSLIDLQNERILAKLREREETE